MSFNLEKAMKNNGLCEVKAAGLTGTRLNDGKIVYTKMPGQYSILVVVPNYDTIYRFSPEGFEANTGNKLCNAPEVFDVWVILYKVHGGGSLHSTVNLSVEGHEKTLSDLKAVKREIVSTLRTQMTENIHHLPDQLKVEVGRMAPEHTL